MATSVQWMSIYADQPLAHGSSSHTYSVNGVIKTSMADDVDEHLTECAIYTRLKAHPSVVRAHLLLRGGTNAILLERMGMSLREYLGSLTQPLSEGLVLNLAQQLLEGFNHLHTNQVIQSDVGTHNVLINPSENIVKLCDFAGSSLDGFQALVFASGRVRHPWHSDQVLTLSVSRLEVFYTRYPQILNRFMSSQKQKLRLTGRRMNIPTLVMFS